MPLRLRLFLLSFVSATCIFGQVSDYTLKVDVPYVLVDVTVRDEQNNKVVDDLSRQSFEIYEDGVPQEIRYFSKQSDLPLRIGRIHLQSASARPYRYRRVRFGPATGTRVDKRSPQGPVGAAAVDPSSKYRWNESL